jgi:hypothetical protein
MTMEALYLLEPSSSRLLAYQSGRVPALGSMLVCNLEADVVALAQAYSCHSRFPWCPIAVVVPPRLHLDPGVLEAFEPHPGALAPLVAVWTSIEADPDQLRSAIIRRPLPSGSTMAGYVRRRTDRPDASASLEICFTSGLQHQTASQVVPRSTLGRHLRSFGPLKPHDWVAVGYLVQTLWAAASQGARTVERAALRIRVDPRTLRTRLQRYCGCGYPQARTCHGWEWIVEGALRRSGYVASSGVGEVVSTTGLTNASSF